MPVVINGSTGITSPGGDVSSADNTVNGLTVGKGGASVNSTALGYQAGNAGSSNYATMIGYQAGYSNTDTAQGNAFVGWKSGYANTSGNSNVALGTNSFIANTTGSNNTALGQQSLFSNTTASNNTAVGYQAGYSNTTSAENTMVGATAGYNATGQQLTIIGKGAGYNLTTGANNTFIGVSAGYFATTGTRNTFIGVDAGISGGAGGAITTGSKNTIIGGYSGNNGGLDIRTASNYIVLSDGDGNPRAYWNGAAATFNGQTTIKSSTLANGGAIDTYGATGDLTIAQWQLSKFDNNSTTSQILVRFTMNNGATGQGQINGNGANAAAFGSYSDSRLKKNIVDLPSQLNNIMSLRPVEFDYIESEGGGHQIGFIAQEVKEIYPDLVGVREDGMFTLADMNKNDARLIKAIQEQQKMILELKLEVDSLKQQLGK